MALVYNYGRSPTFPLLHSGISIPKVVVVAWSIQAPTIGRGESCQLPIYRLQYGRLNFIFVRPLCVVTLTPCRRDETLNQASIGVIHASRRHERLIVRRHDISVSESITWAADTGIVGHVGRSNWLESYRLKSGSNSNMTAGSTNSTVQIAEHKIWDRFQ